MKVGGSCILLLFLLLAGCQEATCQRSEKTVPLDAVPPSLVQAIRTGYPQAKVDAATEYSGMTGSGYILKFHDDHGSYTLQLNGLASDRPLR